MTSLAFELVAQVLAPACCAACDARVPPRVAFCRGCRASVVTADESWRGRDAAGIAAATASPCIAAFEYGGAVGRAITRLKYQRRPDLARPLGDLLGRALEPCAAILVAAVVVPVPLHPSRLAERGYNQSALIARRVARALGLPVLPMALARVRDTPPQATLDRAGRASNLIGAFRARRADRLRDQKVLLIDDVSTTGATLDACTTALVDAGARWVARAVVARVVAEV